MDDILTLFIPYMNNLITHVCKSHDINHMITVYKHSKNAVKELNVSNYIKTAIKLASLLHDIDDHKFFNTSNYSNARMLLCITGYQQYEELVIKMIEYVSSFSNKNNINDECKTYPWLLIPRICDRIEAIGIIGIKRCVQYSKTVNTPIFTNKTLIAKNKQELYEKIATKERYDNYTGKSDSVVDHMYDKLLHICDNPCNNLYLEKIINERKEYIEDFCLDPSKWNYKYIDLLLDDINYTLGKELDAHEPDILTDK